MKPLYPKAATPHFIVSRKEKVHLALAKQCAIPRTTPPYACAMMMNLIPGTTQVNKFLEFGQMRSYVIITGYQHDAH